jgi:putative iron-regulated protein
MGSMGYGELAGQRMKLGLLLHDPEEEHDCFSDLTYLDYLRDVRGIENVYLGHYVRTDGSVVSGPSMSGLVAATDPALDSELKGLLKATLAQFEAMKQRAGTVEKYDQMIGEGNDAGNAMVQGGIDALIAQTRGIERVIAALGLSAKIEPDDTLDSPDAIFQ